MILPASTGPHWRPNKMVKARIEIADLQNAIQAYESVYGRLPISDAPGNGDITLGLSPVDIDGFWKVKATRFRASNANVIVALMSINTNADRDYRLNPQRIMFLDPQLTGSTNEPGVSVENFEYRDPWGNPYVISLDTDQDGLVRDGFYGQSILYSNGLSREPLVFTNGFCELRGPVMVWSRGPDGKASFMASAHDGVNHDNIVSWQ